MDFDFKELSADEHELVVAHDAVVRDLLNSGISVVDRAAVARQILPVVLSVYREARMAGLCHDGACELARERARVEVTAARHEM